MRFTRLLLCSLISLLFLCFSLAPSAQAYTWNSETIAPSHNFSFFKQAGNSALDAEGKPHMVYGGKGLFHSWYTGSVWQIETVNASINVSAASLAVDSAGKLHIITSNNLNGYLSYFTNSSGTWTQTDLDTSGRAFMGEHAIATDSTNKAHVAYARYNEQRTAAELQYFTNASGSWVPTLIAAPGSFVDSPAIAVDGDDAAHISFYSYLDTGLYYASNNDGPWSVEPVDVALNAGSFTSIALDSNKNVHISYWESQNSNLKYANNIGGSWSKVVVATGRTINGRTSILVGTDDIAHIISVDQISSGPGDYYHASNPSGFWTEELIAANRGGWDTAAAIDSSNKLHLSNMKTASSIEHLTNASGSWVATAIDSSWTPGGYYLSVDGSDNLHLIYSKANTLNYSNNSGGSWSADDPVQIPANRPINAFARSADGSLHFFSTVADQYDGSKKTLYYTSRISGVWNTTEVTTAGFISSISNIVFDLNGTLHLSYYPASTPGAGKVLKHLFGTHDSWSSGDIDTNDGNGWVGDFSSLAVDADGKLHVSYYDEGETALKYATNSSGNWVPVTLDSLGSVGKSSTIAIDKTGKVHITYIDEVNSTIKHITNSSGLWVKQDLQDFTNGTYLSPAQITVDSKNKVHVFFGTYEATNASGTWITAPYFSTGTLVAQSSTDILHLMYIDSASQHLTHTWSIPPLNAYCGTPHGGTFITVPTTDLCSAGTPSAVTGSGPWNWTCQGQYGGSNASCFAGILQYNVTFSAGQGGSVSPEGALAVNYGGTSSPVTATPTTGYRFVNWTGSNNFVSTENPLSFGPVTFTASVTANFERIPVDGVCGPAHGSSFSTAPDTDLCTAGIPGVVFGSGPWDWQCGGRFGGADANCSASLLQYTISHQPTSGGSITCTPVTVNHGGSSTCTITSDPGYALTALTDNNSDILSSIPSYAGGSYIIGNIVSNHELLATFSPLTYGSQQLTSNLSDDSSSDSAVDSLGNLHVVYQRDGSVYYRYYDRVGAYWLAEETVGAGSSPAIAVGNTGHPHVVFLSGGAVKYRSHSGLAWNGVTIIHPSGANFVDIDVDSANNAHIVLSANPDTDLYQEILYTTNASGSFMPPAVLSAADGFHDDANFFSMSYEAPSIKMDIDGKYHIVCRLDYQDDLAGPAGSSRYFFYFSNRGNTQVSTSPTMIPWNTVPSMGKSSIALRNDNIVFVTYWVNGTVHIGGVDMLTGAWIEETLPGTYSSVTTDAANATVRMAWVTQSGNAVSAEIVNNLVGTITPLTTAGSRNPVAHGAFGHVVYENNASGNWEVYASNRLQHPVISPAPYDFGMVPVGQGVSQILGVKNSGNRPLTVSSVTLLTGTDFAITSETCTAGPVAANDSCAITLTFSPQATVALSDTLKLVTDEPGNGEILLSISGSGAITNGVCGASNGGSFAIPPTMELCSSGSPSGATLTNGMWNWTCSSPNGGSDASCSANLLQYLLTVQFAGTGGTAISSSSHPGTIICLAAAPGNNCSSAFDPGTVVTLTASSTGTSELTGWAGSDTNFLGPTTVTMDADKTVTASFDTIQQPVLIYGKFGHDFLGMAVMTYQNSDSIMLKSTYNPATENVLFDQPYTVSLTGGYDNSWALQTGSFSKIKGSVKVKSGKVTARGIKIGN